MRNQQPNLVQNSSEYERAVDQLRRGPADLTDAQISWLRSRNPELARMAELSRARNRRGAEFQQRVDEAEYAKETERRRLLRGRANRPGEAGGAAAVVGPTYRPDDQKAAEAAGIVAPKKIRPVVRLLPHLRGGRND
jgi:hypothetical protein